MSKISIILPTYNVEKYIARALDSCINQTFKNIEIIVVDDCGSDKSIDIAKEYASKDKRIKIIHNEKNLGTFASRNIGVLNSSSPYIIFLDPDDYLDISACEKCVEILNDKNAELIVFDFIMVNNDKKEFKYKFDNLFCNIDEYCYYNVSNNIYNWNLCSKLISKNILLKAMKQIDNSLKLTMAEDFLLYFFIVLELNNVFISSERIYFYVHNNDSSTTTINIDRIKQYIIEESNVIKIASLYLNNNIDFLRKYFLKKNLVVLSIANYEKKQRLNLIKNYKKNYLFYKISKILIKNKIKYLKFKIFLINILYSLCYKYKN
ncbi:glycosyltransferase family 2 protein [Campylobacter lari]|uniref:glycosyltransferase family 2 protein n=1 Tax=Campylobacter lari TaxID=201 RepID=UPI00372BC813